jgi:hypothetical protein
MTQLVEKWGYKMFRRFSSVANWSELWSLICQNVVSNLVGIMVANLSKRSQQSGRKLGPNLVGIMVANLSKRSQQSGRKLGPNLVGI